MEIQSPSQRTENFLSFSISPGLKAMLPAQQLAEIISIAPDEIVPIPQMSASVVGVLSWQGEVLWTVDLSYWMGFEPLLAADPAPSNCHLLKIKSPENSPAFLIEKVGKIVACEPENIQSNPANLPAALLENPARKNSIKGAWIDPRGERFLVIDAAAIFPPEN